MLNEVRVAIANDDDVFRNGLSGLLTGQDGFEVVASLETGRDAVVTVREIEPDVLFLDMNLGDLTGLDVLRQISGVKDVHTIALVDQFDVYEMTQALLLGACGAIQKSAKAPVLFKCLRTVLGGDLWFRRELLLALLPSTFRIRQCRWLVPLPRPLVASGRWENRRYHAS